jgi:pterin-4a-carbinolamine dehydratase
MLKEEFVTNEPKAVPSLTPGNGASPQVQAVRRPALFPTRLKAERVQLSAEGVVQARLKAERVQEKLRGMPGWRLMPEAKAIDRVRQFPDPATAAAYASFLAQFASRSKQPVGIELAGSRVGITLWTKPQNGRRVGLTEAVLNFARALG